MSTLYENIPAELTRLEQWVAWSRERDAKLPKIAGTLRNAKSTDPATWRSFGECVAALGKHPGRYAGIGFVFTKADPYIGVDLDGVRDPRTGVLSARAAETVSRLASYAEISPSGTGVKLWICGALDRAWKKPGLEIYPHARYFATTGRILPTSPQTVEARQEQLAAIIREGFPEPRETPPRPFTGAPGERLDLLEFLAAGGIQVLRGVLDGTAERVWAVVCPWWREHSRGDTSGTRVGQYANGALWFRCEHAHCAHRGWGDLRDLVAPRQDVRAGKSRARRVFRGARRRVA